MTDPIIEKLDREWVKAVRLRDYPTAAKVLRAKVNMLKSTGNLLEHQSSLAGWVKTLEDQLGDLEVKVSLTVIGHLRHAKGALSLTASDVGSAFRSEISPKERARFRKRNRPPQLGIQDRGDLPKDYATGPPSHDLLSHTLGNGKT
jgi:hypothetical protein